MAWQDVFQQSADIANAVGPNGPSAKIDIAPPGGASWLDGIMKSIDNIDPTMSKTPKIADASGKTSGGLFDFSGLTDWFDPVRVVTVLAGLILFAGGVFLLGKGPAVEVVKDAITGG